jgi:GNAT superfamily N-acetyltransferase
LYGWREKLGWSDKQIDELFKHVDADAWSGRHQRDDAVRKEMLGDESHWYLALLLTWPEWQGRGVARRLLDWGIQRADAEDPPIAMYLETSAKAKRVYDHVGFVQQGEGKVMIRRGPKGAAEVNE